MFLRKLIVLLALLPCAMPVMAMKTPGSQLAGRPEKRQTINSLMSPTAGYDLYPKMVPNLHEKVRRNDLYGFGVDLEFKDADPNQKEAGFPLYFTIVNAGMEENRKDQFLAVLAGNEKVNWNAVTPRGFTPLHAAAEEGDAKRVQQLLEWGAKPKVEDITGLTPLHYVDFDNSDKENADPKRVVQLLCDRGANPNATNVHGKTPLFLVADNAEHATCLSKQGGDAEWKDHKGRIPKVYLQQQGFINPVLEDRDSVRKAVTPSILNVTGNPALYAQKQQMGKGSRLTFANINR